MTEKLETYFGLIKGNYIYRHPRVQLHVPKEESFPIPNAVHQREQEKTSDLGCVRRKPFGRLLEH